MRIDVETNEEEDLRLSGLTDAEDASDQLVGWVEGQLLEAAARGAANPARPYTIGGLRAAAHKILARSLVAVEVARPSVPGEWLDGDQIGKLRAWLLAGDSEARIPVHRGAEVVGYVRVEGDGRLRWEPEQPELPVELPVPPFGGRPAYERVLDALRNVELDGPVTLEFAVAGGLDLAATTVMQALFGDHTDSADQQFPRIELPWPRDLEQFEELLLRIPLWSIVAHLVRDRDTEVQHRAHLARMFPDEKVPPLLDHLDRTLRDSRELWRVCVEQERLLARVGEALDRPDPRTAIRAILEAGRG